MPYDSNWLANILKLKRLENIGGQGNFAISPEGTMGTSVSEKAQPTGTFDAMGRRVAPIPIAGQQPTVTPSSNALRKFVNFFKPQKQIPVDVNAQSQQPDELSNYWKKPVLGKMPRDQFVQLMGTVAQSLTPNEWSGRLGGSLAQVGGSAYGERMRREYEAPGNALRRRLQAAQIQKYERPETVPITPASFALQTATQEYNAGKINKEQIPGRALKLTKLNKDVRYKEDIVEDPNNPGKYLIVERGEDGSQRVVRYSHPEEVRMGVTGKLPNELEAARLYGEMTDEEKEKFRKFKDIGRADTTYSEFYRLQGERDKLVARLLNRNILTKTPESDKYAKAVEDRIAEINQELSQIPKPKYMKSAVKPTGVNMTQVKKEIGRKTTKDGRIIIKYDDDTYAEMGK